MQATIANCSLLIANCSKAYPPIFFKLLNYFKLFAYGFFRRGLGRLPGARQTLLDMQEYLVTATDAARFYRRMGFIETEQCNYRLAVACFLFSLRYEESEVVKNELTYITAVTGKSIRIANLEAALKRAGLPILEAYRVTDENFVSRRIEKVEIV